MFSAKKGDINLLNAILKSKPDVNARDSKNRNALFYAISSNIGDNPELVNALLNSGINPNDLEYYIPTENIEGHSPLTLAAKLNYKNTMKALLQNNANPNHQVTSNYNSCLHYAIINNNEDMVNILIEARANINILNREDITPINMALKGSNGIIYWKLAHENERLQIESEINKMKRESENINFGDCNIENLKKKILFDNLNSSNIKQTIEKIKNFKNNDHLKNKNINHDLKNNPNSLIKNLDSNLKSINMYLNFNIIKLFKLE